MGWLMVADALGLNGQSPTTKKGEKAIGAVGWQSALQLVEKEVPGRKQKLDPAGCDESNG